VGSYFNIRDCLGLHQPIEGNSKKQIDGQAASDDGQYG
jgi:hypothetical protein